MLRYDTAQKGLFGFPGQGGHISFLKIYISNLRTCGERYKLK